jgi:hypothetical protein
MVNIEIEGKHARLDAARVLTATAAISAAW